MANLDWFDPNKPWEPKRVHRFMNHIYAKGGNPEVVYMTLESAHFHGVIGCWRFQWLKLIRSVGIWTRSAWCGVLSVLRITGTDRTA
jgi:hypothetical protein